MAKLNLGSLLGKAVKAVKKNPEIALVVAGVIAPKLVAKAAPIIVKAKVAKELVE
jgi:hypothetical protein